MLHSSRPALKGATRVSAFGVVLAAAWMLATETRPARACSSATPAPRVFWPRPDTELPRNTSFRILYAGGAGTEDLGTDVTLKRSDGGAIPFDVSAPAPGMVLITPRVLLDEGARYDLSDRRDTECGGLQWTRCPLRPVSQVVATFHVGALVDRTAPRFEGIGALDERGPDVCTSGGCCGPYTGMALTLSWPAASDDVNGSAVLYKVEGPGLVTRYLETTSVSGWQFCSGGSSAFDSLPPGRYTVHAEDWAGHVDANTAFLTVPTYCPLSATPKRDASVADGSREIILLRGGCACDAASGRSRPAGRLGALVLLAPLLLRRRPRPPADPQPPRP